MPRLHEDREQLKPGRRYVGRLSYMAKPPQAPFQKTFRADPALIERIEERALEESMRLGVTVRFSDLIRRGIDMVLAQPLPGRPAVPSPPCNLVAQAGRLLCLECRRQTADTAIHCPRLGKDVTLDR